MTRVCNTVECTTHPICSLDGMVCQYPLPDFHILLLPRFKQKRIDALMNGLSMANKQRPSTPSSKPDQRSSTARAHRQLHTAASLAGAGRHNADHAVEGDAATVQTDDTDADENVDVPSVTPSQRKRRRVDGKASKPAYSIRATSNDEKAAAFTVASVTAHAVIGGATHYLTEWEGYESCEPKHSQSTWQPGQ